MNHRRIGTFVICAILLTSTCIYSNGRKSLPYFSHPGYYASLSQSWPLQKLQNHTPVGSQPRKAMLYSVLIPGLGQAKNKSYKKAALFMAVEAASWFLYFDQKKAGNRLNDEFESYADAHWNPDGYWQAVAQEAGCDFRAGVVTDCMREFERATWSHQLPETKDQHYYENIGKYDQFNAGWDDTNTHRDRDSENRKAYTFLRKDSNDAFGRARLASTITILNHIISALEAGYSAKKNELATAMINIQPLQDGNEIVPALAVRLSW